MGRTQDYYDWLDKVQGVAMRSEWCIEPDDRYWRPKFARGLTPEQATEELWDDVNPARKETQKEREPSK